jgi:SNF2 family DNA or RNA helicase
MKNFEPTECTNFEPFAYQRKAVDHIKKTPRTAIFTPMSSGKTGITLLYIKELLEAKTLDKSVLIVCPLTVIPQWVSEINKFEDFKNFTYQILNGANLKKTYVENDPTIFLINYESLVKLFQTINKKEKLKFNTIVYDESSKLKSHKSKRFKAACKFSNSVAQVILLSATPNPNCCSDLWAQYFQLDNGQRLLTHYTKFITKYFEINPYCKFVKTLKPGASEHIAQQVADITYRITEKELPPKPELYTNILPIYFSKNIQKKYETLEKKFFYGLESLEENIITANSAATVLTKCRQFIQGFVYEETVIAEEITTKVHEIHGEKLKFLKDFIESFNEEPVIIAYNYKHERYMLKKAFPAARQLGSGISAQEFQENVELWNAKKIPVLLCNPASVSHGLNLQAGGCHIVWFSLTYSYENYTQLVGRLHRTGQAHGVHNHLLIVKNTLDEVILSKLQHKDQSQKHFLDLLQRYKSTKN